ncbi:unnamed protein product [Hermetia illucens]|uniref:Cytochrome P450 n=1 Tax=Hermetia illucens TaxID=343691 RepID=A0A7R8UZQ3_HERIL|nr:unnamed protein product [Hermetia illucens]
MQVNLESSKGNGIDFSTATPLSEIPGPTAISLIVSSLPGGKFYKMELREVLRSCRKQYGDIMRFPSLFGNPSIVFTHKPEHFEIVFRTEGQWPVRPVLDTIKSFRENIRSDIFGVHAGLLHSQGKKWGDFRSIVNPVLMQPKTTKLYIPIIDQVASDFLGRIRFLRNPTTNQLPENFEDELNKWTLESIGVIALDTRLGLISNKANEKAMEFIENLKLVFELAFDLEFNISIWRIVATPKYKKLMKVLDSLADSAREYIEEAAGKLKKRKTESTKDHEESVLEKLLKIDPIIAQVMAIDMIFAGVDTTSSAFTGALYLLAKNPDKQEILRNEIRAVLPEKDSSFTIEKMTRLPYLRACIKESQRIFPTLNGNVRGAGQNIVLDGYQIPKGTFVAMLSPDLQMDDKYFPVASKFLPERWLKTDEARATCPVSAKAAHPFIYMPFGFGPRMCIGRRLAELEMEILLSKLVRNFHISWEHPDLKFKWSTINAPVSKLMFTLVDVEK